MVIEVQIERQVEDRLDSGWSNTGKERSKVVASNTAKVVGRKNDDKRFLR